MPKPFADLPRTAETHFQLHFFGAVREVLTQMRRVCGSDRVVFEKYPFPSGYSKQIEQRGAANWDEAVRAWESDGPADLPLQRLAHAGELDRDSMLMLFLIGLPEEDARFGALFGELNGSPEIPWPTLGVLTGWWLAAWRNTTARAVAHHLLTLQVAGAANAQAPRPAWALQPLPALWDALHGSGTPALAAGMTYVPAADLPRTEDLIHDADTSSALNRTAELVGQGASVILRGPRANGRRTAAKALARSAGRGALIVHGPAPAGLGPMATVLHAMPVLVLEPEPGQTLDIPALACFDGPLCVVLGRYGGISGPLLDRSITLDVPLPGREMRARLWSKLCPAADPVELAEALRCSSGTLVQAARLVSRTSQTPTPSAVQDAARLLGRQHLDRLAEHVDPATTVLAVPEETRRELVHLESRCRYRERLRTAGPGVRSLFRGPSGTGKTLAAQWLARNLGRSLYRAQIGNLVNKYLGETEKNLDELLSRAEELDAILLIDEGDALLAPRTGVRNSNDRYANLETNFLLQRFESFTGIILVTTNAADRIDKAFARRMDVVVDFTTPDANTRYSLWQIHLPDDADVDPALLDEVAARCQLTGGQIRNVVLHAAVLAMEEHRPLCSTHLETALASEYRKAGAVCPLRNRARAGNFAHAY